MIYGLLTAVVVPIGGVAYALVTMFPTRVLETTPWTDVNGLWLNAPVLGVIALVNMLVNHYGRPWWVLAIGFGGLIAVLIGWVFFEQWAGRRDGRDGLDQEGRIEP